ncbi:recombination mediator RecR [Desulfurobacterium atlanticum]|uniref:Recombination protein RecR n=1 Tax=Desulfurobacterium atlanticum TaxID=240169 RepID=A0A238XJV5_9BACT|nr:recombination mediator RecR [Desulfurobacterium atlanticum]SNR58861.1 DNA replication and repair protein RecR [Desulfurobacterium atlanticum]
MIYPETLEIVIDFLSSVSGISERAAERAVLSLAKLPGNERIRVINALKEIDTIKSCSKCGLPTVETLCPICASEERDKTVVCVVEQPRDAVSIEKLGKYKGVYHVLGGLISPLENIGPEDLRIKELFQRLKTEGVKEIIIALNPTVEGEATAKFLIDRIRDKHIKIYRIAYGIPYGGTIDMADELTLKRSFEDMKLLTGGD